MSSTPGPGDQARATVQVRLPPIEAFEVFTTEIDQWWRRGSKYRASGQDRGVLSLEPRVGGRLYESISGATGIRVVATGEVLTWEPPHRLVLTWRGVNFAPHERTEVEVTFTAVAGGTRVEVTHRGWREIRPDHPARHGLEVAGFVRMLGMWWGELLTALRQHVNAQ